jgi:RNA polymerase sigma-70 factor, ECF subfamily
MNARDRLASLELARRGDSRALGELLESFRPYVRVMVHGLCDGRLQARLDESDLIQDALLGAYREFARFRGSTLAELTAWLRQIVLRTASHLLRHHLGAARRDPAREQPIDSPVELTADEITPAEQAMRSEQAARMAAALARLPEDMQQVLLGRHLDDLPYTILAERLGRSEAAVRVLYTRALRRLREECRERGND